MERIVSFLTPANTTGISQGFFTLLNLLLIFASVCGLDYFLRVLKSSGQASNKKFGWTTLVSIGFVFMLSSLSIYSPQDGAEAITPTDKLIQFLVHVLDPIFQLSSMRNSPLFGLTGINLSLCVLLLCGILAFIPFVYRKTSYFATAFGAYLKNNMPKQPTSPPSGGSQSSQPVSGAGQNSSSGYSKLLDAFKKLAPTGSFIAILFGYIFGTDKQQQSITEILEAFESFLNTVTFTAQLDSNISSVSAFLSNFFYIILSICVLAIYGLIFAGAVMLVKCAFEKKDSIIAWVTGKANKIWFGAGVSVLFVFACTVVFVFSSGFTALQQAFSGIFSGGTQEVFALVMEIVILILAICAVMFIVGFGILFAIFTIKFCAHTVKSGFEKLDSFTDKIPYIAAALFVIIIGVGLLIGFVLGYDSIRDGLHAFFNGSTADAISPLWVVGHMFMLVGIVFGLILAVFSILILGKVVFSGLVKFSEDKNTAWRRKFVEWIEKTVEQLIHLLYLIPFTLKHIAVAARNFIATMLRIFVGYSTEAQKNKALFVAACFASLASLLNTFFGLKDFYSDDKSVIPVICSFAIACAVQLAMLIFGMKAGEGFAERIMTKNALDKGSEKTVLSKIFLCLCALTIYVAVVLIFYIYLSNKEEEKLTIPTILAVLSLVLTTFGVIYYVISQCMSIRAMRGTRQLNTGNPVCRTKRIPPYWYMAAYLLLMIVSTGFAFSNTFGYYAEKAHLHQRVYEQVRNEADIKLDLGNRVTELVEKYYDNNNEILSEIDRRADAATAKLQSDLAILEANILELSEYNETKVRYQNSQGELQGHTRDFATVVAALKTYLTMEVEDMSDITTLTIYTYEHYWGNSPQPSYITKCIKKTDSVIFGREISTGDDDRKDLVTVTLLNGDKKDYNLINRFNDPDGEQQSIAVTFRTINYADKYVILDELLSIFEELESYILAFKTDGSDQNLDGNNQDEEKESGDDSSDENSQNGENESGNNPSDENSQNGITKSEDDSSENKSSIYDLLDENARLDGIRANIASLYRESIGDTNQSPSTPNGNTQSTSEEESTASDGVRVTSAIDDGRYPTHIDADTQSTTAEEQKKGDTTNNDSDLNKDRISVQDLPRIVSEYAILNFNVDSGKEVQYQELNAYIDKVLNIHDIMVIADAVMEHTQEENNTGDNSNTKDEQPKAYEATQASIEAGNQQNSMVDNPNIEEDQSQAYSVRTYLNYAQGITFSNFQISYDALLKGGLGLNPVPEIDALHSSNIVAIFMLLICALVDLVAFFSGLLLFKNIFLFVENEKIKEIGYLNYDAILTDFFTLPEKGTERVLRLALIYRILYGEFDLPKTLAMNSGQFENFYDVSIENLEALSIKEYDLSDLRFWLTSFVQANEITFDDLLFEQESSPPQDGPSPSAPGDTDETTSAKSTPDSGGDTAANETTTVESPQDPDDNTAAKPATAESTPDSGNDSESNETSEQPPESELEPAQKTE